MINMKKQNLFIEKSMKVIKCSQNQANKQNNSGLKSVSSLSRYKFIPPAKILHPNHMNDQKNRAQRGQKQVNRAINEPKQSNFQHKVNHYQSLTQLDLKEKDHQQVSCASSGTQDNIKKNLILYEEEDLTTSPLKYNQNFNKKQKKNLKIQGDYSNARCFTVQDVEYKVQDCHALSYNIQLKKMFRSTSSSNLSSKIRNKNTNESQAQTNNQKVEEKKRIKKTQIQNNKSNMNINHNKSRSVNPPKILENIKTIQSIEEASKEKNINKNFEHQHIQKLTEHIHDLRSNQNAYLQQIQDLQQKNKLMKDKLRNYQLIQKDLSQKTRSLGDYQQQIRDYEYQLSQKCHQHSLIIDSLKKIISSQQCKIIELQEKLFHCSTTNDLDSVIQQEQLPRQSFNKIIYKKQMPINSLKTDFQNNQYNDIQEPCQNNKIPNFGLNTLNLSDQSLHLLEDDKYSSDKCSLLSSSRNREKNLNLSRIEQSAEDAECSTGRNDQPYEHQQLLNEIDRYLSKWNQKR